jgi:hypothetical protein
MAFVDYDQKSDFKFANVSHPVGPGKPNLRDDVTLVQLCLIMFGCMNPRKTSVEVLTQPIPLGVFYDDDTGTLIKDYQKNVLRRPKPEGYVDTARGKDKARATIYQLNLELLTGLRGSNDPRHVLDYLRAFPNLAASLWEPEP